LPPLRERREDILPLARQFLQAVRPGTPATGFDHAVALFLLERDYPGNVRELRQLVERIGDRHVGPGPITTGDVPDDEWSTAAPSAAAPPAEAAADGADAAESSGAPLPVVVTAGATRFDEAVIHALHRDYGLKEI